MPSYAYVVLRTLITHSSLAGRQSSFTDSANVFLKAGLHQLSLEYFNGGGQAAIILGITELTAGTDASSSFVHDPAGPCNADCAVCNTPQQYCLNCTVATSTPVGGVCTSPLSVTP